MRRRPRHPLDALHDLIEDVAALAAQCGDPHHYSDGRRVKTAREIEFGLVTEHIWHPDPSTEEPRSWRGTLRHDPEESCPGVFEVSTDPATQEIFVRTVRAI